MSLYSILLRSLNNDFMEKEEVDTHLPHILSLLHEQRLLTLWMADIHSSKELNKWNTCLINLLHRKSASQRWAGCLLLGETISASNYEYLWEHIANWMEELLDLVGVKKQVTIREEKNKEERSECECEYECEWVGEEWRDYKDKKFVFSSLS